MVKKINSNTLSVTFGTPLSITIVRGSKGYYMGQYNQQMYIWIEEKPGSEYIEMKSYYYSEAEMLKYLDNLLESISEFDNFDENVARRAIDLFINKPDATNKQT
jgi:hypothetical protein